MNKNKEVLEDEREIVIFTGRKGMYVFDHRMKEFYYEMLGYKRFLVLRSKGIKNKKLYNTFIHSFINRTKGHRLYRPVKLIDVFNKTEPKVNKVITRFTSSDSKKSWKITKIIKDNIKQ